jgi:polyhydroxybutyrate depolymerase
MRRRWVLMAIVASVGLMAWRVAGAETWPDLPEQPQPGTWAFDIESTGHPRHALVHIPKGYDATQPPPMVVLLHGAGGTARDILFHDKWAAKGDSEGFLILAPNGLPAIGAIPANFATNPNLWNSGQLPSRNPRTKIDDVAYIGALLDSLKSRLPYNERRVFCTGHSNGGGMTFRLAGEIPERFTAIATVAGQVAEPNPQPKKKLPTLFIFGEADPVMPMQGGEVKLPWGTRRTEAVDVYLERWAKAQGCATEREIVSDKGGVQRLRYASRENGPDFDVVFLKGHGHAWPGSQARLPERVLGPSPKLLDATDEIWAFFSNVK